MVIAPQVMAANISVTDSLILMVLALVVVGPRRLPQLGRQIGKLMYEFRKASNDFKFQMEEELRASEEADRRKKEEEERQKQLAANPPAQIEASTENTIQPPVAVPEPVPDSVIDPSDPYAYGYGESTEEPLRVQPPSTGETVAADKPTSEAPMESTPDSTARATPTEPQAETTVAAPASEIQHQNEAGTNTAAHEDADKTIESAARNG